MLLQKNPKDASAIIIFYKNKVLMALLEGLLRKTKHSMMLQKENFLRKRILIHQKKILDILLISIFHFQKQELLNEKYLYIKLRI